MSDGKNFLLPLILDILSHKPLMCETENNLFKDVDKELGNDNASNSELKKQFKSTVDMGKGLGILSVQDDEVRMPFLLQNAKPTVWSRNSSKPKTRDPNPSKTKSKVNTLSYRSRSRSRNKFDYLMKSDGQKTKKNRK